MKLHGKRRGRWRKTSAKKVQFEELTKQKGQDNDNVRANCTSQKPVTTIAMGDGDFGLKALGDCARDNYGRLCAIDPSVISIYQVIDSSAGIEWWAGYEGPTACDQETTIHIPSTKPRAEILRDRQTNTMSKARRDYYSTDDEKKELPHRIEQNQPVAFGPHGLSILTPKPPGFSTVGDPDEWI